MKLPVSRTIDYRQLEPVPPGFFLTVEWDTYRREVPRLLSEGLEGKYILIQGSTIIGIWDTEQESELAAARLDPRTYYHLGPIGPRVPCFFISRLALHATTHVSH